MGNYLLFDEHGRLVATRELALAPGAIPAETVFPGAQGTCVEVHPAVLLKIRPQVWSTLVGHAVRHHDGVRVDELHAIRHRLEQGAIRTAERTLVDQATRLATRDMAARTLQDGLPPYERETQERLRIETRNAELRVERMRRGHFDPPVPVPPVLVELAGKVLPL